MPSIMFSQQNIIEGTITSLKKPVSDANIIIAGTKFGTTSDGTGFFRISGVSPGKIIIKVTHINFEPYTDEITIEQGKTYKLTIELEEKTLESLPVTVTAFYKNDINISSRVIDSTYIHSIPSLAEPDLFRSLTVLPGVVRSSDFTTQFFVRGGSPDQNMILIDNAELYNPNHIGGIVSAFDVDIIKNAELKTGGYSSRYGGKLSSILHINTKEGNQEKTEIKGGVGLLSSKLSASGSFSKGSWIASIRRTYFDIITRLIPKVPSILYNFTDVFGKLTFNFSRKHRAVFSLFSARDITKSQDILFSYNIVPPNTRAGSLSAENGYNKWGSHLINFSTTSVLKESLILENKLSVSVNDFKLKYDENKEYDAKNFLMDLSFKNELSYKVNEHNQFTGGIEFNTINFDYKWKNLYQIDYSYFFSNSPEDFNYRQSVKYMDIFFEGSHIRNFSLNYGLRLHKRLRNSNLTVLPVLGFNYPVYPFLRIKGVFGQYYQDILTSREEDITSNWDIMPDFYKLYFPLKGQKPEKVSQFVASVDYDLSSDITFNIEAYMKNYHNLYLLFGPDLHFDKTTAVSKGIEFSSRISKSNYNVLFNYALSRSEYRDFISRYNKTHIVNIAGTVKLSKKSSLGFTWNFSSGFPYTPALGKYSLTHAGLKYLFHNVNPSSDVRRYLYYGERNSARYPAYHRLDLSYRRFFETKNYKMTFALQVFNVYNRKNYLAHQSSLSRGKRGSGYVFYKNFAGYFPIIPTFGLTFERK